MREAAKICYSCGGANIYDFFEMPPVPTQDGVMCASEQAALQVARGSIKLRYCRSCGYVGNEGHEPEKVRFDEYDFSNDQSPIYARFTQELCDRLIARYQLRGKTIVDIGCGDGDFLQVLCKDGDNKGIGIDPGFDHSKRASVDSVDVTFLREYYSAQHAQLKPDLIASRHVISLTSDPLALVRQIRENLQQQPNAIVYFETPNVRYTFGEKIIWNVVYEHRSWYSRESLCYLMEVAGFEVLDSGLCWNNAFTYVEARPRQDSTSARLPNPADLVDLESDINNFSAFFSRMMAHHSGKITEIRSQQKRVIAWGAGARAVTFFNLFDLKQEVPYVVDVNYRRQGKFLPGSGQRIVEPEFIKTYQPELLIITNPTYEIEIRDQVRELGLQPEFWVL